jgi:hypothetical protein
MAKAATKTRVTKKHVAEHRVASKRDTSPRWDDCESWTTDQFLKFFKHSMDYYRIESNGRELKPQVINWMSANGYPKEQIKAFKDTKDFRSSTTMGSIAANLLRGMPAVRADFNEGRNTAQWLGEQISKAIKEGENDKETEIETEEDKSPIPVMSIQDRLREAAARMTEEIDEALDSFSQDPESFDPKAFKVLNLLKGKQAKAAHARVIKGFYERNYLEVVEAAEGKCDQLKEGYSHLSKKQLKKLVDFYHEIVSACDMLTQEAKINKKPRVRKAVPAEKIVAKMKYSKTHEPLKLVSINPATILGSKELWVFNFKTRKLGKYVAAEYQELGVKGTSITGFDENQSVQKTLRKPEEQLKEFKSAGKIQLRKFLDEIKSVDIKLNGRINEDTILLKIS